MLPTRLAGRSKEVGATKHLPKHRESQDPAHQPKNHQRAQHHKQVPKITERPQHLPGKYVGGMNAAKRCRDKRATTKKHCDLEQLQNHEALSLPHPPLERRGPPAVVEDEHRKSHEPGRATHPHLARGTWEAVTQGGAIKCVEKSETNQIKKSDGRHCIDRSRKNPNI